MLAQSKLMQQQQAQAMQMQEMQKQRKAFDIAQGLSSMGVPGEMSEKIAMMPESQQNLFLKQFFGSQAFGGAAGGQTGQLEEGLQTLQGAEQMAEQQGMPGGIEQLLGEPGQAIRPEAPQVQAEAVETPEGEVAAVQEEQPTPGTDMSAITQQVQSQIDRLSPSDRKSLKEEVSRMREGIPADASREAVPGYRIQRKPTSQKSFQELLSTPRPSLADKKRVQDMRLAEEKMSLKKRKKIDAETRPFFKETMAAGKGARENDMRIGRMENLIKTGKLNAPGFYSLLETVGKGIFGFGINLKGTLLSEESQAFEKLTADFAKGAKEVFGSRLSTKEVELYMKSIPNLSQSDGGKRRVIRNWKLMNEAAKVRKSAMMDIIEMNGGRRPANLEMMVEKKVGPKLDRLSEKFKEGATGKKKKEEPTTVIGKIFGGIEGARRWLEGG
jgi:hypothetical protein